MRTFGSLALVGRTWVIGELEPHVRIRLKSVFPKVPKTAFPPYEFPADAATAADLEWFESRYRLAMTDEDRAALDAGRTAYENAQAEARAIFSADYQPPVFAGLKPGQEVRRHQAQNVELLRRFGGVLVADDVGEGKTYTAGAACLTPGALPATIVVPPHLAVQWRRKLEEFTTLSCHVVTKTRSYELPPVDVRIFGFTQLAGWIDVLEMLGTGLAVFDEGHELRHGTATAKGEAAARLCEVSRMRMMMTATPVFNYGDEIWNVMRFVRPEVLGLRSDFLREWCPDGRKVSDPPALGTYLREQNAMTRKLGGGSAANRVVETIPHDHARLEGVEALAYSLAYTAVTGAFEARGQAVRELNLMLRHETGVAKASFVAKYVRALVEASGEPLILFGWHRDVYDIWLAELKDLGCVMYTGSESPAEKNRAVQRFVAGEAKVFIMSLRSGAGVDGLQQVCRRAVFGELDWSPAMHDQCIGRLNREGQRIWDQDGPDGPGKVDAIFLVAEDGSDPPIVDMLGIKSSQADGIVNPTVKPQREAADRAPIEKLIARYLGKNGARVA